jgi:hypothetical protein
MTSTRQRWGQSLFSLGLLVAGVAGAAAQSPGQHATVTFVDEETPTRPTAVVRPAVQVAPATTSAVDTGVVQTGCSSCGSGLLRGHSVFSGRSFGGYGCGSCGDCGAGLDCASCADCIPGREKCCGIGNDTFLGRVWGGVYECICCPDPCFEPRWIAAANNAMFAESPRPVTQVILRAEFGQNWKFTDIGEYRFARSFAQGRLDSLARVNRDRANQTPPLPAIPRSALSNQANTQEIALISETAVGGKFSAIVKQSFRGIDPADELPGRGSGFGDLMIGTKSLLLDCELIQFATVMNTYIPTGSSPSKGAGVGHVALEPGLLVAVRLAERTYLQSQVLETLPIGGDSSAQACVLNWHMSLNHSFPVFCGMEIVPSWELFGYNFQGGQYSDYAILDNEGRLIPQRATDIRMVYTGPSMRMVICNTIDFGFGAAFALTSDSLAEQFYRAEFRWRF